MIKSCGDKDTQAVVDREPSRRFQAIQGAAERKLALLSSATDLKDWSLPSLRLEKLAGNRKGQHSIRINLQYRICFERLNGDAYNVEIVDYH